MTDGQHMQDINGSTVHSSLITSRVFNTELPCTNLLHIFMWTASGYATPN